MAMKRVDAIVTTDHQVAAYGGMRLPLEMLHAVAIHVRTPPYRFTFNHDGRKPLEIRNVDSGVRQAPDGSNQVWMSFDIDEADWEFVQGEFSKAGAPGGMSFSFNANPVRLGAARPPGVVILADAGYFDQDEVTAAAADLAVADPVEVRELYQFGALPPPLIVIEIKQQASLLHEVGVGVVGSVGGTALIAFLKRLLRPRHRYETNVPTGRTVFAFHVERAGQMVEMHLETDSEDVVDRALDSFQEALESGSPILDYRDDDGGWVPPN